ncbi:MAG: glyoxylase-like metal-dependent hydrolase (beta-lactamase superfamily II) [Bacteriovoracaceae bacterium]|jgi:glyoxylase-like metal-dependent hydrolase (beta-lactamase superfamily II)/8-oxo-dGTP pyrophosphatase MutT (NUDIX family)
MRKAVTVVFTFEEEIFSVKRQNYLTVFPGYLSFPGGKVDREDSMEPTGHKELDKFAPDLMQALIREVQEEVNVDLRELPIKRVEEVALAVTPEFNPYRFETYFYWVELTSRVDFDCDEGEVFEGSWKKGSALLKEYEEGLHLAVPPTVRIIERFAASLFSDERTELRLPYNPETQVPWIESISGIKQFLPRSHTFPPANRTNCFLIGDTLIDPSPIDEDEYLKLKNSISSLEVKKIFLTHHHPDHHEFAPRLALELNLPIFISLDSRSRIEAKWGEDYFKKNKVYLACDGDILTDWKGKPVHLMAVPGHDEGQLAPYVESKEWIIAGDLFQSVGTVVVGGDEGDMAKYFSSLEKVIALNPKAIFPSHGIALGGVHKLKMTLAHRKKREAVVLKLAMTGKNTEEIFEEVYEGLEARLKIYAIATIEKHLEKLIKEGSLKEPRS